jgi:hypothetical protein
MISPKRSVRPSTPKRWAGRVCRRASIFDCLLIGCFEGVDSERRIASRAADSLAPRD